MDNFILIQITKSNCFFHKEIYLINKENPEVSFTDIHLPFLWLTFLWLSTFRLNVFFFHGNSISRHQTNI